MELLEYLKTKPFITMEDVLTLFADKVLDSRSWEEYDTVENAINLSKDMIKKRIVKAIGKGVPGKIIYVDSSMCDEDGIPIQIICNSSYIRTSNVINWAIENGYLVDSKVEETATDVNLTQKTSEPPAKCASEVDNNDDNQVGNIEPENICNELIGYEDIISDETILKLKELPLPQMKQQVAILAAEKKKSDAAIIAATRIGLLFYESGLPRPTNEKSFVDEYKKHFDKLPPLPKTTIERIYKHLPEGYRRATDGGKVAEEQQDIDTIIKAATFAGYLFGSKDIANVDNFIKALNRESYSIPEETVLSKIVAIAGKLDS